MFFTLCMRLSLWILSSVQTMTYSAIVFDTAPTGHTLRLLGFPDLLEKGLARISGLKSKLSAAFGLMGAVSGTNIQANEVHTNRYI